MPDNQIDKPPESPQTRTVSLKEIDAALELSFLYLENATISGQIAERWATAKGVLIESRQFLQKEMLKVGAQAITENPPVQSRETSTNQNNVVVQPQVSEVTD